MPKVLPEGEERYRPRFNQRVTIAFGEPLDFATNGVLESLAGMETALARSRITQFLRDEVVKQTGAPTPSAETKDTNAPLGCATLPARFVPILALTASQLVLGPRHPPCARSLRDFALARAWIFLEGHAHLRGRRERATVEKCTENSEAHSSSQSPPCCPLGQNARCFPDKHACELDRLKKEETPDSSKPQHEGARRAKCDLRSLAGRSSAVRIPDASNPAGRKPNVKLGRTGLFIKETPANAHDFDILPSDAYMEPRRDHKLLSGAKVTFQPKQNMKNMSGG
ncbi:hypothetical protein BDK51DRAFT_41625 [Blyttiomyces helicus]|uniref:Uncharacterized protein n=1 Tax=Blyttiomyces helicus TaxID=388810 RepID=A0A4P9W948_9FUNG|nr:hypothetical protein BDK51DRAFT_41625 [Blyttiomyces helicus]|eukprot:RKO88015.1 hypothetical protein BDK51DRAFT_41625 [Blyttiomyces helicus]